MKVVINRRFGGFRLSDDAEEILRGTAPEWFRCGRLDIPLDCRHDERLIDAVESLGPQKASGRGAMLAMIDVPDDIDYVIYDYDGLEMVIESGHYWT